MRSHPLRATPDRPLRRKRAPAWFAVAFTLIGLFLAAKGVRDIQRARATSAWPATEATILSGDLDRTARIEPRGVTSSDYTPRIRYSYSVGDHTYVGERVSFVQLTSEHAARSVLERFSAGARVPVYYDPHHPAEAVLLRDGTNGLWAVVAFGLLFAALGAYLFRRSRADRVHRTDAPLHS